MEVAVEAMKVEVAVGAIKVEVAVRAMKVEVAVGAIKVEVAVRAMKVVAAIEAIHVEVAAMAMKVEYVERLLSMEECNYCINVGKDGDVMMSTSWKIQLMMTMLVSSGFSSHVLREGWFVILVQETSRTQLVP